MNEILIMRMIMTIMIIIIMMMIIIIIIIITEKYAKDFLAGNAAFR